MKIVFFGSSKFALKPLAGLIEAGFAPVCVVTQPDKHKARGMRAAGTAVKEESLRLGMRILQPENINDAASLNFLRGLNADLFVVAAYGRMLSEQILSLPGIMAINLHPSLLPKYRGAAPLNWALINGDKSTGVCVVRMVARMDAGPVLRSMERDIPEDEDAISLGERLSAAGAELLVEAIKDIEKGVWKEVPQKEEKATFARLLKKEDGRIDWNKPAFSIHNLVRGCAGWPGTFSYFRGKTIKITKAVDTGCIAEGIPPGEIISVDERGLEIACGRGSISVMALQPESKKEMTAREFINGYKPLKGEHFTAC